MISEYLQLILSLIECLKKDHAFSFIWVEITHLFEDDSDGIDGDAARLNLGLHYANADNFVMAWPSTFFKK